MSYKFPTFKAGNKSFASALNAVVDAARRHGVNPGGRPGWVETDKGWMPPHIGDVGGGKSELLLWDIEIFDAEEGIVKIKNAGTIIKNFSNLSVPLEVENIDSEFEVAANEYLYIKITGAADLPVATLESGPAWEDHPAPVETTNSGETAAFASYYYPLWQFLSESSSSNDVGIKEDLFAKRLVANTNFLRGGTTYHKDGDSPFWIHFLMPYHGLIS
jgi:hypothetical protein